MATTFKICFELEDGDLAKSIARECIEEIDRLETILSRYVEGSDIDQINHMQSGSSMLLSDECYGCIRQAMEVSAITEGLFDITLGKQAEQRKRGQTEDSEIQGTLILNPDKAEIHCTEAGRELDLGGIGKGYTLDHLAGILKNWNIERALLSSGASTILAINPDTEAQSWPIKLYGESSNLSITLNNCALSASGTQFQGSHIIAPQGRDQAYAFQNVWLTGRPAAYCDAFTTACFLMSKEELTLFCEQTPEITALYVEDASGSQTEIRPIP